MYDGYIYCEEDKNLKDTIVDVLNGDTDVDIEELEAHIQELYDDLMSYIQDM